MDGYIPTLYTTCVNSTGKKEAAKLRHSIVCQTISKQKISLLSPGIGQDYHSVLGCDPNKLWQLPIILML